MHDIHAEHSMIKSHGRKECKLFKTTSSAMFQIVTSWCVWEREKGVMPRIYVIKEIALVKVIDHG